MILRTILLTCIAVILFPGISLSQQPELVLPIGHSQIVRVAGFSPDGKFVVTAGVDRTVNIWETFSGKKVRAVEGMKSEISNAWFSDDSRYLVASGDSSVIIWKLPFYEVVGEFNTVKRILLANDGKYVFIAGNDGKIRQYSLPGVKLEREYAEPWLPPRDVYRRSNTTDLSKGGNLLLICNDTILNLYETATGKKVKSVNLGGHPVNTFFTNDGVTIIAATDKGLEQIDISSFNKKILSGQDINLTSLSRNKKYLLTSSGSYRDRSAIIWDLQRASPIFRSDTVRSANDTFYVITDTLNGTGEIRTGTASFGINDKILDYSSSELDDSGRYVRMMDVILNIRDNTRSYRVEENNIRFTSFSKDGRYLLIQQKEGEISLWDVTAKKIIQQYKTQARLTSITELNASGEIFLAGNGGNSIQLVDAKNGKPIATLQHKDKIMSAEFSTDGTKVLTNSVDSTAALWDARTGQLIRNYPGQHAESNPAYYTVTGKIELIPAIYDTIPFYDLNKPDSLIGYLTERRYNSSEYVLFKRLQNGYTGRYKITESGYDIFLTEPASGKEIRLQALPNAISRDDRWLVFACEMAGDCLTIYDIETGKWIESGALGIPPSSLRGTRIMEQFLFTNDNKYLLVADENSTIHVLSVPGFKQLYTLPGNRFSFSADDKYLLTLNLGKIEMYNFKNRELLYSYLPLDDNNFLVIDSKKRFDGTETARKLIYFSCGVEIIELSQAKDQLWVPGLTERIMKNDSINNKTIAELNICGLTPVVEEKEPVPGSHSFFIRPRRGGLGETIVYVNGIEARRYQPGQQKKVADGYELTISESELRSLFVKGTDNPVTVKAYTADNTVSSRGAVVTVTEDKTSITIPNLFLVSVGISDYKGDELDLKYAAKDATDISRAVANAARKLLNTDNKEHVFAYNLNTAAERYQLPEKNSIKKVLAEIGTKANANDILFIFFAGHGIMSADGNKQQFYFLTADASKSTAASAVADVGISTTELTDWIKPQNIKAQKRILIFDACNSGQAIKDFVKIGGNDQGYIAARSDEKGQQVKTIEKLNEQSGLFILSASASNQSAYEMGRYSQGLLTYSLLKAIKEQPDILQENKYLDVSRWFNAAEKTVSDLTKENGARQQPQIVSNTNFNIGIVDEDVIAKIILPDEKPLFTASIFLNNDEAIGDDDLDLSKIVNRELADIAIRSADNKIIYITATNSPDAYTLTGRYEVKGELVTVKVNLKKNKEIIKRVEVSGSKTKLNELAASIVAKAAELVK